MQTIDFMPDRLPQRAHRLRGFTTHEMFTAAAAGVGCAGGSVISIPPLPLAGWLILGPTGRVDNAAVGGVFGGNFSTRIKRGKPENYLTADCLETANRFIYRTLPLTGRLTENPSSPYLGAGFTPDAGAVNCVGISPEAAMSKFRHALQNRDRQYLTLR